MTILQIKTDMKKSITVLLLLMCVNLMQSQKIDSSILTKNWRAFWIASSEGNDTDYGVYHFRKIITLAQKPARYDVHVSADNRYKLFINGRLVSLGPARSDLNNWKFESLDIAPYLQAGENSIGALVWNEGKYKGASQISARTAFIMQGNTDKEADVNTNSSWDCEKDNAYSALEQKIFGYYIAGASEAVDMNKQSDAWLNINYQSDNLKKAKQISMGVPKGIYTVVDSPWMLVPSDLPQMERTSQRFLKIRYAKGLTVPKLFPAKQAEVKIPANSTVSLLLDQTFLVNAYPVLEYSKGKNASVTIQYAEGLLDNKNVKGNRNEIEGKKMIGRKDSIICNGLENQVYTTLYWRTYRYVQLDIKTQSDPLVIKDIYGVFTAYPFKNNAVFSSNKPLLDSIVQIGWRTARLCAEETYMDCPFYEQLQYVGDARIQAMVSYFNSGDDRLAKNAVNQIDESRLSDGYTQSRYPTTGKSIIPTFSLLWIGMVSDFYHYRRDDDFVRSKLPGIRQVLSFFDQYKQEDGTLKNAPYWNFVDWPEGNTRGWKQGMAPVSLSGNSAANDLYLLYGYQLAAEMENGLGNKGMGEEYHLKAEQLKKSILKNYWDETKKMFADNTDKKSYSQQVNTFAILTKSLEGEKAAELFRKMINDESITKASIYFQYYLNQAMAQVGEGNQYLNHLGIWKKNISLGMTTWGEDSRVENTRSDCHAWGASPNIEFFRIVLGINSDIPGFSKVRIEPHLGDLQTVSGEIPHPEGKVSVKYKIVQGMLHAQINLPLEITGIFIWKEKSYPLKGGINNLKIK